MVRIEYFQPAQATFSEASPLNILLVADSPADGCCVFRFYASTGTDRRLLFSQEKTLAKGHNHLYFQLPAPCFGAETWDELPDELTLWAATESSEGDRMLLFRA